MNRDVGEDKATYNWIAPMRSEVGSMVMDELAEGSIEYIQNGSDVTTSRGRDMQRPRPLRRISSPTKLQETV